MKSSKEDDFVKVNFYSQRMSIGDYSDLQTFTDEPKECIFTTYKILFDTKIYYFIRILKTVKSIR